MSNKVYEGDIGTAITLDCVEDISSALSVAVEAMPPGCYDLDDVLVWPAAVFDTTFVRYFTQDGDLSKHGKWKLQPVVTMPGGVWRGRTAIMVVHKKFK